jgi:hypothetical protein
VVQNTVLSRGRHIPFDIPNKTVLRRSFSVIFLNQQLLATGSMAALPGWHGPSEPPWPLPLQLRQRSLRPGPGLNRSLELSDNLKVSGRPDPGPDQGPAGGPGLRILLRPSLVRTSQRPRTPCAICALWASTKTCALRLHKSLRTLAKRGGKRAWP